MRPSGSREAIEPPPAPIDTISMTGMRIGRPLPLRKRYMRATSKEREICGRRSSISVIFAVVPPISKESAFAMPFSAAMLRARITPPAGPDSTRRMGKAMAVSTVVTPPPDIISSSGQKTPRRASPSRSRPR